MAVMVNGRQVVSTDSSVRYLFVDGASLDRFINRTIQRFRFPDEWETDLTVLFGQYSKIFYYDAYPQKPNYSQSEDPDGDKAKYESQMNQKSRQLRSIQSINNTHVFTGLVKEGKNRGPEQKGVDVKLSVDMMMHSFRRNMTHAAILTSDLDFKPLIEALVLDGMNIDLLYERGRANEELLYAPDSRTPLTVKNVYDWSGRESKYTFQLPGTRHESSSLDRHAEVVEITRVDTTDAERQAVIFRKVEDDGLFYIQIPTEDPRKPFSVIWHEDKDYLIDFAKNTQSTFWKKPY